MLKRDSKTIKKSQKKMKKGDISEKEVQEKIKTRRVVVPVRSVLRNMSRGGMRGGSRGGSRGGGK
jgi:hypothetical protein